MLTLDARPSLALALETAARTGRAADARRLRRLGLTYGDALALAGLADADGASLPGLAGRLHVTRRSVASAVARLAALGRVERDGDEVWLTPAGRIVHAHLARPYRTAVDR